MFGTGNLVLQTHRLSDKSHQSPRISLNGALKSPFLSPTYIGATRSMPTTDFSRMTAEGVLSNIPLFKRLNEEELHVVAASMERVDYPQGQSIFQQGDAGDAFYIIQSGECSVYRVDDVAIEVNQSVVVAKSVNFGTNHVSKGTAAIVDKVDMTREYPYTIRVKATGVRGRVATGEILTQEKKPEPRLVACIKAGDFFGEQSLLHGGQRGASVMAASNITVLRLTRDRFVQNQLGSKLTFPRRKAVLPLGDDHESFAEYEKLPRPKPKDTENIIRAMKRNDKLSVLHISDDALKTIASGARLQTVETDQVVIKRGELQADLFYIVESGEFTFTSSEADPFNDKLAYLGKAEAGSTFGEVALLHNAPRAATVVCTRAGKLWVISRKQFKTILSIATSARIAAYTQILEGVELLQCLTQEERKAVSASIVEVHALKGETIIKQGDPGDAFFILIKGTVEIVKDSKVLHSLVANPGENTTHWFGERALLENEPRAATVQVASEEAYVLALKRIDFERLLGPLEDIMREAASNARSLKLGLHYDESTRMMEVSPGARKKDPAHALMTLESLEKKAVLGVGGFGAVHLVQHKPTKKVFALKALSKGYVLKMKMQKSVLREKEILSLCDSTFIVKMYRTFKNADTLFFLLEAFLGGELYHLYHRKRWHGSVSKARFYSASVVCAFEFLHSRHVLYRDLKPENLLLDSQGFCKLTDMGLAKIVSGKTYTTCGTPDYFSPEVIQQTGQTKAVDWWTLGVLIHELLSGHAPFTAESSMATYKKVILGIGKVEMKYASNDPLGASLVVSLLKHNAGDRLPMRTKGLHNLFDHPWYRSLDWAAFKRCQVAPPYVPVVKDSLDSSNFHASKSDAKLKTAYVDPKNGWDDTF